jgi:hypothetical protein
MATRCTEHPGRESGRTGSRRLALGAVLIATSAFLATSSPAATPALRPPTPSAELVARVSIPFVPNGGRFDERVAFQTSTAAASVFVTRDGAIVYRLPDAPRAGAHGGWRLVERFVGGVASPVGGTRAPTMVTRFDAGADGTQARTLPTYRDVSLGDVWDGVNVRLVATDQHVEKVYTLEPGAPVSRIRMEVAGTDRLSLGGDGTLIVRTDAGDVTYSAPVAFQEVDGERRRVAVAYVIEGTGYGFEVGAYDASRPLVIDPFLRSTYIPGVEFGSSGLGGVNDIASHPATGDVYLLGTLLCCADPFPGTEGGAQPAGNAGTYELVVARFDPTLTTLLQATYYGAAGNEIGKALAVTDAAVFVYGATTSQSLPGIGGGAITTPGSGFVARFLPSLTDVVQATFLPGSLNTSTTAQMDDMVAHPSGDVYVSGSTLSPSMPGTAGAFQPALDGGWDAFIIRFNGALTAHVRSTYLGGSVNEDPNALAVDPASGDLYVGGHTTSSADFPGTSGGAIATGSGGGSGFVARISADLGTLRRSTFVWGRPASPICRCDEVLGLVVHPHNGDVYIAGDGSADLPAVAGAAQSEPANNSRAPFIARLSPDLTGFVRSTYFGNETYQRVRNFSFGGWPHRPLAVHPLSGDLYLSGDGRQQSVPGATGGAQATLAGPTDPFIVRFNEALTQRLQSTHAGGSGAVDVGHVLMIHPRSGDVYLAGGTRSADIPGTTGGFRATKPTLNGYDGFVLRVSEDLAATPAACSAFTDVPGTSAFCASVEWLKNREVTLGCVAGQYCPGADVTRLAMAAFMQRLGTALTGEALTQEAETGAIALGAATVVCSTADHPVDRHPARATLEAVFMARADAGAEVALEIVASFDGGSGWTALTPSPVLASAAPGRWENVRVLATTGLWVGETVRFGLRASQAAGGGPATLDDSRCTLRARVGNRTAINSPF